MYGLKPGQWPTKEQQRAWAKEKARQSGKKTGPHDFTRPNWTVYGYSDLEPGQWPTREQAQAKAREKAQQSANKAAGGHSGEEKEEKRRRNTTGDIPEEPTAVSVSLLLTVDIVEWLKVYHLLRSKKVISDEDEEKLLNIVVEVILSSFPAGRALLATRDVYNAVHALVTADNVSPADVVTFVEAVKALVQIAAKGPVGLAGPSTLRFTNRPQAGVLIVPGEVTDMVAEKMRDTVKETILKGLKEKGHEDLASVLSDIDLINRIFKLYGS